MNIKNNFFIYLTLVGVSSIPLHARYQKKISDALPLTETLLTEKSETTEQSAESKEHSRAHIVSSKPSGPIYPPTATDNKDDMIEVNLEKTDLTNILAWIEDTFKVIFLTEDALKPPQKDQSGNPVKGAIGGNSVNFKTNVAMTKKQVWDLFITFLDLFGLALTQEGTIPNLYRVRPTDFNAPNTIYRSPLPSYINVHWQELPDNDMRIRYVYFVRNSTLATITSIVNAFKSQTAPPLENFIDLNAFILTDKSCNIRSIMKIVEELDNVSMPEAMSVLKLKNADATDVATLYDNLTKTEDPRSLAARILGTKKQPTALYFPPTIKLIPEARTNTLIILGDKEGIKKVEEFIINYVDVTLKVPYSPLYVYPLQYTKAGDIVTVLNSVTKLAPSAAAALSGGVREGNKYLQPMTFVPEIEGNSILIKAEKEDYLKVRDIIRQLDVRQPQIAIEVLIVNVISSDLRQLGIQIRNKEPETIHRGANFQNSGLPLRDGFASPIVEETTGSLLGNLITLATNQSPGATLISIGNNVTGVWGMFKILQNQSQASIVANPFLITTNNYAAQVSIGATRRVQTAIISGQQTVNALGDLSANLTVNITPQINSIGIINLKIDISIDSFTNADPSSANVSTKTIKTNADVGNGQVLALGGLLKTNQTEHFSKVPILGDIPLLGWFFKNKGKTLDKNNLLVFISPRVVEPLENGGITSHTQEKINFSKNDLTAAHTPTEQRDPLHRWFFNDKQAENTDYIDNFVESQNPTQCIDVPPSLYCAESCNTIKHAAAPEIAPRKHRIAYFPRPAAQKVPAVAPAAADKPLPEILVTENTKTRSITNLLPPEPHEVPA